MPKRLWALVKPTWVTTSNKLNTDKLNLLQDGRTTYKIKQLSSNYVERINSIMDQQQAIADAFGARVNKGLQDIKFLDEFAASRFMICQEQLNRAFAAQALTDQASSIKLAQNQGVAAASGQSGVTAARRDFVSPLAAAGRNRRIQALQVTGLIDDFDMQSEIDNKQFAHQKYSIGQRAAVLPRFGRIPSQPTMPQMQKSRTLEAWVSTWVLHRLV